MGKTRRIYNKKGNGMGWYHPYLTSSCNNKDPDVAKVRKRVRRELMMEQLDAF